MKTIALFLLCLSLTGACHAADAADSEPAQDSSTSEQDTTAADTDSSTSEPDEGGPTIRDNDDFIPTVQISEDLSVSFPVDI